MQMLLTHTGGIFPKTLLAGGKHNSIHKNYLAKLLVITETAELRHLNFHLGVSAEKGILKKYHHNSPN